MLADQIKKQLKGLASPEKAKVLQGFFKTGPGEYGEGDVFLGITVPQLRQVARAWQGLTEVALLTLLHSTIHEERLLALLILVEQFQKSGPEQQKHIARLYLNNTRFINNWDLVDLTAPKIIGAFLFNQDRSRLHALACSPLLWERRIAIVATFFFIKNQQFTDTFAISQELLSDKEDLIHKAVGWMLREVGKQSGPPSRHS